MFTVSIVVHNKNVGLTENNQMDIQLHKCMNITTGLVLLWFWGLGLLDFQRETKQHL